ncbi:phage tail length tape measure family protein [Dehalobacter sp. TeCB1]|uniref:phage tail protein n=1 Tax=Dehalobacter sp. TeCB1 TaxID=1843715 RepID=UPI000B12FB42|nr:phage tail length tape measure family protein [Dehalobacter sp. TeCB1]
MKNISVIDLATYSYNLEINDKGFTSGMLNAEGNVDKFQGKLGSMTSFLKTSLIGGLAAAGAAIGGLIVSGVKDASEAEEKVKQLEAVLKSTGQAAGVTKDQALGLADAFEKTTKFAAEQTLEGENLLLTFTNIGKDVFPQVTETMLNMSQALGQDTKNSAIQLGKALNDPINGVTALSRVGVSFTEEQKNQIKTLQESGNVMGAQKVILAELTKEFGGSAAAAGQTFSGQMEITNNMLGQVSESIGVKLMPYLMKFLQFVQSNMPAIQSVVGTVFSAIETAFTGVGTNISELIQSLQIFYTNNKVIFEAVGLVIKSAFSVIESIFKAFMALLKGDWSTFGNELLNIVQNAWGLIKNLFNLAIEEIKAILRNLGSALSTIGQSIMNMLWNSIKSVWDSITSWFSQAINGLITWFTGLYQNFFNVGSSIFTAVWDGIKSIWEGISSWISEKVQWIQNMLSSWRSAQSEMASGDSGSKIPAYAVGTPFVPNDQIALIHKGEAIIPAQYNPYNPSNKVSSGMIANTINHNYSLNNVTINTDNAKDFFKQIDYLVNSQG